MLHDDIRKKENSWTIVNVIWGQAWSYIKHILDKEKKHKMTSLRSKLLYKA